MIEKQGDLFSQECDAICITTNGMLNFRGLGIMGKGVALQAKELFPGLPWLLGQSIQKQGNVTAVLSEKITGVGGNPYAIVSLPTKNDWRDPSDIKLIKTSVQSLVQITTQRGWTRVCLSRLGTGNGGLNWRRVRYEISPFLDDRFIVVSP